MFSNVVVSSDFTVNVGNAYTRTITAGTVLTTSNIWLNPGTAGNTAADGTGFDGATTTQVSFLKGIPAENAASLDQLPAGTLALENGLDALFTESEFAIIKE